MKTSELFQQALSEVPKELKIQIDLSFAISDKLDAILQERGMTQKEFAKLFCMKYLLWKNKKFLTKSFVE